MPELDYTLTLVATSATASDSDPFRHPWLDALRASPPRGLLADPPLREADGRWTMVLVVRPPALALIRRLRGCLETLPCTVAERAGLLRADAFGPTSLAGAVASPSRTLRLRAPYAVRGRRCPGCGERVMEAAEVEAVGGVAGGPVEGGLIHAKCLDADEPDALFLGALVVSEPIRRALEASGAVGALEFLPVVGPPGPACFALRSRQSVGVPGAIDGWVSRCADCGSGVARYALMPVWAHDARPGGVTFTPHGGPTSLVWSSEARAALDAALTRHGCPLPSWSRMADARVEGERAFLPEALRGSAPPDGGEPL